MTDDSVPVSTERQRITPRLGYAVPCRCECTHDEDGHRHACIAGEGHVGWHRCYCGEWFEQSDDSA